MSLLVASGNGPNGGGGGDLADIKTNMLAWYDFDDATDSHGSYDATETGTPTYASGHMTGDGSNYLTFPSTLYNPTQPGDWATPVTADATIAFFYSSQGASNGQRVIREGTNATGWRYMTTEAPNAEVHNVGLTAGGSGQTDTTIYMGTIRVTGDAGSSYVVERIIDGAKLDQATGTAAPLGGQLQTPYDGSFRIYWMGFWDRKLTDTEITALHTEAETLAYVDLP